MKRGETCSRSGPLVVIVVWELALLYACSFVESQRTLQDPGSVSTLAEISSMGPVLTNQVLRRRGLRDQRCPGVGSFSRCFRTEQYPGSVSDAGRVSRSKFFGFAPPLPEWRELMIVRLSCKDEGGRYCHPISVDRANLGDAKGSTGVIIDLRYWEGLLSDRRVFSIKKIGYFLA